MLEQGEDGRRAQSGLVDFGGEALRQAPGQIFVEAAAGDVADALHRHGVQAGQHRLDIDAGGGQQGLAQGGAQLVGVDAQVRVLHVEDLAHQGVAVGVDAGGGQGDDHISGPHGAVVHDLGLSTMPTEKPARS